MILFTSYPGLMFYLTFIEPWFYVRSTLADGIVAVLIIVSVSMCVYAALGVITDSIIIKKNDKYAS